MGSLSDRYGRRPVLLTSLFGLSIDDLILAFAPDYTWLVVSLIITSIGGASCTTASAYITAVSTKENHAKNFYG